MDSAPPEIMAFDEVQAIQEKKLISRVTRPVGGVTELPSLETDAKKVLLIVPPGTLEEQVGRLSAAAGELPMLGLAYIAASLRDQGHDVRVLDFEIMHGELEDVEKEIRAYQPDVVGMTAYITSMRRCAAVCEITKACDPSITTILGGPQVTIFPEEAFISPDVDLIVLSEGEIIIRNVMNALGNEEKLCKVPGIWFRGNDGVIIQNEKEILVDNLDLFPRPALDLFQMEKYFPPIYIRGRRVAHLLTSRGCPFLCTFCETKLTFGRSFRYHSTERVLGELETLIEQGYSSFQFYDDIFTANQRRVQELCEGILERGLKIEWMCYSRTNTVKRDTLELMRRAGCYMISFGIESGDDALLDVIEKRLTVADNVLGIRMTKEAGIQVTGTFMLGLPTETEEQTIKTIQFSLQNDIDYAIFGLTEPYPGTELWVDAKKYGYFDSSGKYRNNLLSEHAAVWIPNGRTRPELKNYVELAMRNFYFRFRTIPLVLRNLIHLPFSRSMRFLWAGVVFFIIARFKSSNPAHMGTRN